MTYLGSPFFLSVSLKRGDVYMVMRSPLPNRLIALHLIQAFTQHKLKRSPSESWQPLARTSISVAVAADYVWVVPHADTNRNLLGCEQCYDDID